MTDKKQVGTIVQFRATLDNEQFDKFADFLSWYNKDCKKKRRIIKKIKAKSND